MIQRFSALQVALAVGLTVASSSLAFANADDPYAPAPVSPDPPPAASAPSGTTKDPDPTYNSDVYTPPPDSVTESVARQSPAFQKMRPQFGLEFDGSAVAFRDQGVAVPDVEMLLEYEPPWIQLLGVFSGGLSIGNFPTPVSAGLVAVRLGIWSVGAQVRYQARFFKNQIIVPFAGFGIEAVSYKLAAVEGRLNVKGPFAGAEILLNTFDGDGAFEFYRDEGALRSYLVAEGRAYAGSDANLSLSGSSFFFGLRIEY